MVSSVNMRLALLVSFVVWGGCDCAPPVPPPPELNIIGTGFFVGQVFIGEEAVDGAVVQVAGLSASAISEADKSFALFPIPVGEHTISIHDAEGRARRFKATIQAQNQTLHLNPNDTTLQEPSELTGRVVVPDGAQVSPTAATVFVIGGTSAEVATPGDDGEFVLRNIPPGELRIGVGLPGYDLVRLTVQIEAGTTQALAEDIVLAPVADPEATVTVSGTAATDDEADHSGTLILVDDGEEIVATDSEGNFSVDVKPGHHEFRTERPGHLPTTLPTVGVTEGGESEGVVDIFVAPGQEDAADAGPNAPVVDIEFPAAGSSVVAGLPVPFTADLQNSTDLALLDQVQWTVSIVNDDTTPPVFLGTGAIISAIVPAALGDDELIITAAIPGRDEMTDRIAVVGAPLLSPNIRLGVDDDLVIKPTIAPDEDGTLQVEIAQFHPAILEADDAVAGTILWSNEAGVPIGLDFLDLGQFDPGTYVVTASVETADGGAATLDVRVVVSAFEFNVVIEEPTAGTTYFTDEPLPLRATFQHPFQLNFPADAVRWSNGDTGEQLAAGLLSSTRSATTGAAGIVQLTMTDVVGSQSNALATYVYTPLTFTAAFNTPANNVSFLEAEAITFNISFSHPTLAASDVVVTLASSVQGPLADGSGNDEFAPNTNIIVDNLVPGTHQITARVIGDGRIAAVTQTLTVNADFVIANLQVGASVLALDGAPMRFEVVTGATPGITPRVSWFVDGTEFDGAWDTDADPYNPANPADPGNTVVDFGTYDSSPVTPPFDETAIWGPGTHTVQVWVRLPNNPVAEADGCVNNGSISRCLSFSLTVFDNLVQKADVADVTLTAGQVETWSGGILLKGSYTVDGGTLIIQPGTTVVVDMANRSNPAAQDGTNTRLIIVNDGSLQIGAPGGVPPARFEVRQSFVNQNRWGGIRIGSQTAGVPRNVTIQNTVLRDANVAIDGSFGNTLAAQSTLVIEDLTVENSASGVDLPCPASFERVVFRNNVAGLNLIDDAQCPNAWGLEGLVFENTGSPINITTGRPQAVLFENLTVRGTTTGNGLNIVGPLDAEVRGCVFEDNASVALRYSGNNGNGGFTDGSLRVENSSFIDNGTAFQLAPSTPKPVDFVDNRFESNQLAAQLFTTVDDDTDFHLNRFIDNDTEFQIFGAGGDVIRAEGNFFGDPNDTSTSAGRMQLTPLGQVPNLTRITDGVDNSSVARVLTDNYLDIGADDVMPLAYIEEPAHMKPYNPSLCMPLIAKSPASTSNVDPNVDCTWSRFAIGSDPTQTPGTPLDVNPLSGEARCVQPGALGVGEHGIALECVDPVTGATSLTTTQVKIDDERFSGRIAAPGFTLTPQNTANLLIDGDIIVEEGATLTVAPGTTLRFALSDVTKHNEPRRIAGGRIGQRDRVDIFVQRGGTLDVAGTAAEPVLFRSEAATAVALWGGIVADVLSTVRIDQADVESADAFVDGQQADDIFDAPSMTITNTRLDSIGGLGRGSCPNLVADTTADFINGDVFSCVAASDLRVERSVITDVRASGNIAAMSPYPGAIPGLVLQDSTFTASSNTAAALSLSNIDVTTIDTSTIDGWGIIYAAAGAVQVSVVDSTVRNWSSTLFSIGNDAIVQVDHSTFENGREVLQFTSGVFVMRDSLIQDVDVVFRNLQPAGIVGWTVVGNEFRNTTNVLTVNGLNQAGIQTWTFSGNNFIGTAGNVVDLSGQTGFLVSRIDVGGCFWGAGNDSNAEIELFIDDPRSDASGADQVEGNTDYAGFVTSPLALDLP